MRRLDLINVDTGSADRRASLLPIRQKVYTALRFRRTDISAICEDAMSRQFWRVLVYTVLLTSMATPALAQVDLTGMWAPIFHEDQVERIPGPDVGDYAGL